MQLIQRPIYPSNRNLIIPLQKKNVLIDLDRLLNGEKQRPMTQSTGIRHSKHTDMRIKTNRVSRFNTISSLPYPLEVRPRRLFSIIELREA